MKKAGRIFSILVVVAMVMLVFGVAGCGEKGSGGETATSAGGKLKKEYKIGVISYDYTDQQGKELKNYFSYLEKEFGVKFVYATAQPEEAQVIKAHEDLCAAGVDGIMNLIWNKKAFEVASKNKVYEVVILNNVLGKDAGPNDQGYDEVKTDPYYVGSASPLVDTTVVGEAALQAAVDARLDNLGVIGFPRFWLPAIDKEIEAFCAAAKKAGKTVIDGNPEDPSDDALRLNPMGNVAAQLTSYFSANPSLQFVFAASSGMDLVYPTIVNAGLKGKVKLAVHGYNPTTTLEGLKDGSILMCATPVNSVMAAIGFAMLIDKLESKAYADAPQYPSNVESNFVIMRKAEDAEKYNKLVLGDVPPITADELKKVMKTFNENATYADLKALAMEASDLSKLEGKRK